MKRSFSKVLAILVCMTMVMAALSACGTQKEEPAASGGTAGSSAAGETKTAEPAAAPDADSAGDQTPAAGDITIGTSISTLTNEFFVAMKLGLEEAAKANGVKIVETNADNDTAKQTSQIEDLISQGASAIICNPIDSDAIVTAQQKACLLYTSPTSLALKSMFCLHRSMASLRTAGSAAAMDPF